MPSATVGGAAVAGGGTLVGTGLSIGKAGGPTAGSGGPVPLSWGAPATPVLISGSYCSWFEGPGTDSCPTAMEDGVVGSGVEMMVCCEPGTLCRWLGRRG